MTCIICYRSTIALAGHKRTALSTIGMGHVLSICRRLSPIEVPLAVTFPIEQVTLTGGNSQDIYLS